MLAHRIPPEAELQADLDVGTALGVKLLSTTEIITGEVSLAAGWSLGLAAGGTDGGLCDADLRSDLTDRHARTGQIEDLLLLRRADRTTDRVSNAAGLRGLARPTVGATLGKFDSGTTSAAMKRPRKASQGSYSLV